MTETLAYRYSSESTRKELSNEYQHDRPGLNGFQKSLSPCTLDESNLSIRRVNAVVIFHEKKSNESTGP